MSQRSPIRVMLVDASAFARVILTRIIGETPDLRVAGQAKDGMEALASIPQLDPDVVVLHLPTPEMDALVMLNQLMRENPKPVVMIGNRTQAGTQEIIQVLTSGAVDFVLKPDSLAKIANVQTELVEKIRQAAQVHPESAPHSKPLLPALAGEKSKESRRLKRREKVVVIGTSTGGPRALKALIPRLPADLPAAVLIVQHMPASFTRSLAERLNESAQIQIKQANAGDELKAGLGLLAPGGYHMVVNQHGRIELQQTPPIHGVRPAVDATLSSVAQYYGEASIAVILTGMGSDGRTGAGLVQAAGGWVITEAEASCAVWGMPRSVEVAGFSNVSVPIQQVADEVVAAVSRGVSWNTNNI